MRFVELKLEIALAYSIAGYGGIVDGLAAGDTDISGGKDAKGPLTIVTGKKVVAVSLASDKLSVSISDGTTLSADHVIFTGQSSFSYCMLHAACCTLLTTWSLQARSAFSKQMQ